MGKFKVGDRVRAKEGSAYSVKKGDVCTVTEILNENAIRFRKPDGTIDGWGSENFELVEQPWQPKVGDRARYKDPRFGEATVIEIVDGKHVKVDTHGPFNICTEHLSDIEPLPVAAEAQPALQVVEGKLYRTRDGRKVGPIGPNEGGLQGYPWQDDSSWSDCWTADGRYYADVVDSDHDLIAEWVDEPTPAVAVAATASNDNEPVAKQPAYKVGDKVRSLVDWCDTKVGDILPVARVTGYGVWAIDKTGDETYLDFDEIEPVPQQSTAGFTIPPIEDVPAAAKDGSTQLTVRITSDFTELHEQIDYAFERLKKLKKKARKLGIELDFAKAA